MAELKPCPFCGGEAVAEVAVFQREFRIYCTGEDEWVCPANMRLSFDDAGLGNGSVIAFDEMQKIMNDLVEHWNRRADNG